MQAPENRKRKSVIFNKLLVPFITVVIGVTGILTAIFYSFSKTSVQEHTKEEIVQHLVGINSYFDYHFKSDLIADHQFLLSSSFKTSS